MDRTPGTLARWPQPEFGFWKKPVLKTTSYDRKRKRKQIGSKHIKTKWFQNMRNHVSLCIILFWQLTCLLDLLDRMFSYNQPGIARPHLESCLESFGHCHLCCVGPGEPCGSPGPLRAVDLSHFLTQRLAAFEKLKQKSINRGNYTHFMETLLIFCQFLTIQMNN